MHKGHCRGGGGGVSQRWPDNINVVYQSAKKNTF